MELLRYLEPTLEQLLIFAAIVTRVGGLIATAPVLGANYAPMRIKAFLAVAISLMLTPVFWEYDFPMPGNAAALLVVMVGELLIGLSLGLGIKILFAGVQITGQLLGQIGGLSIADVFNPAFDDNVPMLSIIFDLVVLAVFLVIGGHRFLMAALLNTFTEIPPGIAAVDVNIVSVIRETLSTSLVLGVQAAAPGTVALLIGVLVMGVISRTLPQLNLMAIGFSMNTMLLMAFIMLTIGSVVWIFQDSVEPTVDKIRSMFHTIEAVAT
ncbi:type III secretion protein [Bremerella cremea]|uniref:Type III secretion protein n=1 Tax=Bremerella cremea TaxID=1031537 RepID=A0A368KKZ0_9BACT|nr:flagellar biosynthetic protein FliR [Bremerella cremea]RCS41364.1 type III secretion protein [Bremerella cremea]